MLCQINAMATDSSMNAIIEGLLIGAGAGVVSSILLGAFHWIRRQWARCAQVRFLKAVITKGFADVCSCQDFASPTWSAPWH